MSGKWKPYEVAGAIFVYDEETPIILGNPEGAPLFVFPGDDGIHNAWAAAVKACEIHNAALDELRGEMGRAEICEALQIYQERFDSLLVLVRARRHSQVVDKVREMAAQMKALTSDRDELAAKLAEYLMVEEGLTTEGHGTARKGELAHG